MATDINGDRQRLPIKLIMPKQGAERRVPGGNGPPKPFRTVDGQYRQRLTNQVEAIEQAVLPLMKKTKTAPLRVKVIPQAAAKSHRPLRLFAKDTCPIVGVGKIDELFVKATAEGLAKLKLLISNSDGDKMVKELSTIESIEPVTPASRRRGREADEILRHCPRTKNGFLARAKLFDYGQDDDQPALVEDFVEACGRLGLRLDRRGYAESSFTFGVECRTVQDIEALSKVIGVRSISQVP